MGSKDREPDLGDAIRRRCEGSTLVAESLALGLSKNQLSRWANGVRPGPEFYDLLCRFLDVDVVELGGLIALLQLRLHQGSRLR